MSRERVVVSAKVRADLMETILSDGVPVSRIVEAGIAYYSRLSEEEKKRFLLEETPDILTTKDAQSLLKNIGAIPLAVLGGSLTTLVGLAASKVVNAALTKENEDS